jgi:hypothetical protein
MILFHVAFHLGLSGENTAYPWTHRLFAFLHAGVLGALGYGAVFTFIGLLSKRALIWGITYGFVSEFLLAMVPAVVKKVTLMHYLRSVALADHSLLGAGNIEQVLSLAELSSPRSATITVLGVALVFLALSLYVVSAREYMETRPGEET